MAALHVSLHSTCVDDTCNCGHMWKTTGGNNAETQQIAYIVHNWPIGPLWITTEHALVHRLALPDQPCPDQMYRSRPVTLRTPQVECFRRAINFAMKLWR